MEIKHLEWFLEVARYRSFSKAAAMLHISQPSISKAVRDLEEELGKTLFYRSTRRIQLTDAGESLLTEARRIVAAFHDIHAEMEGLESLRTGAIHIGLPPITAVTAFARSLGDFHALRPKIRIHLYEYGPKRIETALAEGLLDLGIFTPENESVFDWLWFEKDPHHLIMAPGHPLAAHRAVGFRDLHEQPLLIYTAEYKLHDAILERCRLAGAVPEIVLETAQLEMMKQFVRAGLGVALLPAKISGGLEGFLSRPLSDEPLYLELALTWRKDRYLSHAVSSFLDFFRTVIAPRSG
ncbi:MAG: LysR family transcriptional regulator [Gracilibacteraceae bacterium]|jgi:DNA-binding transcriptional LysR family regulator|nr:LysR family transcriptional regulator [Gracilibacteraceae bacterium]